MECLSKNVHLLLCDRCCHKVYMYLLFLFLPSNMFAVLMINLQSTLNRRKIAGTFLHAKAVGHIYHPFASIFL